MRRTRLIILSVTVLLSAILFVPDRVMASGEAYLRADDFELARTIAYETARDSNWKESNDPQVLEFEEVKMNDAEFTIIRSSWEGMVFVSVFTTEAAAIGFQEKILSHSPVLWDEHADGGDEGGYTTPAWLKNPRAIEFHDHPAVRAGGEAANGRVFYGWASRNFFLGCYDYADPPSCSGVLYNTAARHGLGFEDAAAPTPTTPNQAANPTQPAVQPGPSNVTADLQEIIQLITQMVTSPAVPAAGAAAGALTAWVITSLRRGPQTPKSPANAGKRPRPGDRDAAGRIYSPVPGGGWVSAKMYAYQKGLLKKGWRWDPGSGKFVIQDGAMNEKGQVYLAGDPDGEGSRWMNPQDYAIHKQLLANGMVYDRNYGYLTPEELSRRQAGDEHWRQESRRDDLARNRQIKTEMDELRKQQEAARAKEQYLEYLKAQQNLNEFRMDKNLKAAEDYSPGVILGGVENMSREVITGFDPEGGLSISSLALRGLATGISMGKSEIFFQTLNSLYTEKDAIDRGATGGQAVALAVGETIVMEGAGRVLTKGLQTGKTALGTVFPNASKSIARTTQSIANKMEALNRPVSEVFGKTAGGEAAEAGLSAAEKEMLDALRRGEDPAKLYSNGGSQVLGGLEEKGLVTGEQARRLTGQLTQQIDQAVASGADEAARKLRLQTGVQVQKVLVADSGSSGMAKAGYSAVNRSVVTDADRSLMLKVDKDALSVYAHENRMTPEQAYQDLMKRYQNLMDDGVDQALKEQGFANGSADVDYKSYAGIGSKSGPADSYPANYTSARTEMGSTNVRSYSSDGSLTGSSDTSGRAFLDEMGLEQQKHTGLLPPDPSGKIDAGELKNIAGQQLNSAMNHEDVKSVAKALDRGNYAASRQKIFTDPTLSQAAREIVKNPQEMNSILKKFGIDPNEFILEAREQISKINQGMLGGTP